MDHIGVEEELREEVLYYLSDQAVHLYDKGITKMYAIWRSAFTLTWIMLKIKKMS